MHDVTCNITYCGLAGKIRRNGHRILWHIKHLIKQFKLTKQFYCQYKPQKVRSNKVYSIYNIYKVY